MKKLLFVFALVPVLLFAQTRKQRKAMAAQKKADQQVISNLKNHNQFFANKPGESTPSSKDGEQVLQYISDQFKTIGLQPKGNSGYIQQFKIDAGKQIEPTTFLKVNGASLALKKDYFPLPFSASKKVAGMPAMALREKGVPWFADAKDWIDENTKSADFDITSTIQKEAERAAAKGATAFFVYNSSSSRDELRYNNKDKTAPLLIPVIYITANGYNKYFMDNSEVLDMELNVALKQTIKNANNVVGYIDNHAAANILIAAPYDRVYQEEDQDMGDDKRKTNGSGDVTSGTSMLIELARMLFNSKAKNNNYTLIAYSGEDTLSRDSKWLNNNTIAASANYIINLDRVGRYNQDKKLLIEAYGTSPDWIESIKPLADKTLEVSFDSGSIEKDSSIYQVKIPVLNFLTSTAANDDRALSDDGKINYEGELHIARFIYRLIEATDTKGKLAFSKDSQTAIQQVQTSQPGLSAEKGTKP